MATSTDVWSIVADEVFRDRGVIVQLNYSGNLSVIGVSEKTWLDLTEFSRREGHRSPDAPSYR